MLDKETLVAWDKRYLWHPFTQMQDWLTEDVVIIERGEGCYLIDAVGNRYIDGTASMWTNVHGHNHPELNTALKAQLDKIAHTTLLGYSNVPAIRLAQKLVEITPAGLNKVFYSDNGSTAVEIALKMAYQYWQHKGEPQRKLFIHFDNAYHGDTIGAMSVGGIDSFHTTFDSLLFKGVRVSAPETYRSTCYTDTSDNNTAVKTRWLHAVEAALSENAGQVAGIILEPLIQGAGGMLVAPKGFLKELAVFAKRWETLLIVDEVMTGFGRTGKMWACEHENVTPDILCTAKGLAAGYLPLAATLTTDNLYNAFLGKYRDLKTFFHGHTFTGNPLACAVALENIAIFERENLLSELQPTIEHFRNRLQEFYRLPHVGDVRVCGLAAGVELMENPGSHTPYPFEEKVGIRVCKEALARGAMLRSLVNTIVLMPTLQITISALDTLLDIVYTSIETVTKK
ncbi:adenosylmethionine--8-amino-7-oxononanoate transaminase [Candidatus Poribacteria bacterium]|nr:adenosylmethionine--8-amino-7-oxononanoate transaminase [Candidatus Poribacteria bacterium]MYG05959.1 adenosylmethionine--8-amino-7-oxononanoate transaminase [Candidatus Poribacteria bacterium]MYK22536.1 adenosylmethionine--8-amino-7-oxononanoate transaminase [Candidatus Poribacteria bacterium]